MKTVLIGSVTSSKVVLQAMIEVKYPITHVFSLDEKVSTNVSGYYPILEIAENNSIRIPSLLRLMMKKTCNLLNPFRRIIFLLLDYLNWLSRRL